MQIFRYFHTEKSASYEKILEWDAYNEGCDLPMQVERYKQLNGHYPELVQVDKIT